MSYEISNAFPYRHHSKKGEFDTVSWHQGRTGCVHSVQELLTTHRSREDTNKASSVNKLN